MKKMTIILALYLTLVGCASYQDHKLVQVSPTKKWVQINPDDFVPPKARAFIKVKEVESTENLDENDDDVEAN